MIELGKTLRSAREAKGLTIAQLAEMTRMTATRIEELENENFANIPAAIYGRGFVKLYCGALGLDPKPLCDEFTEIFNGNRDVEIRERTNEPTPNPVAMPPLEPSPEPAQQTEAKPEAEPQSEPSLSRYATPLHERPKISVPPSVWRFGLLAAAALLVLWGLLVGVRALYRATSGTPGDDPSVETALAPAPAETAPPSPPSAEAAPTKPRTPQKIPALYFD